MSCITSQISKLFFPPTQPESTEVTFKTAMDALQTQRIARITKAVVYAFASIAATITLVLTEAAVITWPLAIPSIVVSLVAGLIFYRLNSLDKRYIEILDDKTRETVTKKELDRLFINDELVTATQLKKSLSGLNRLFGLEVFDKEALENILRIRDEAELKGTKIALGAFAFEQKQPIVISSTFSTFEKGLFGLPSYETTAGVSWTGNPSDPIITTYKTVEKTSDGQDIEPAVQEPVAEATA